MSLKASDVGVAGVVGVLPMTLSTRDDNKLREFIATLTKLRPHVGSRERDGRLRSNGSRSTVDVESEMGGSGVAFWGFLTSRGQSYVNGAVTRS